MDVCVCVYMYICMYVYIFELQKSSGNGSDRHIGALCNGVTRLYLHLSDYIYYFSGK